MAKQTLASKMLAAKGSRSGVKPWYESMQDENAALLEEINEAIDDWRKANDPNKSKSWLARWLAAQVKLPVGESAIEKYIEKRVGDAAKTH